MARNFNSDSKNKKMNNETYKERRKVMDCIYRAKKLLRENNIEMPRITIRITEVDRTKSDHIGRALMYGNYIWIPADTLTKYEKYLYQTVLHELCHAIWGVPHNQKCKLMHTNCQCISDSQAEKIFLKYAKKYEKLKDLV